MTERTVDRQFTPIKVDIDMKWIDEDIDRIYTLKNIEDIVRLYLQQVLDLYVIHDKKQLYAFVFEKEDPSRTGKKENENKDGIHIMFPYISTEVFWEKKIRHNVLDKCGPIFESLNLTNSKADIIDLAVIGRNNWQMYGSRKASCQAYQLTHIFTLDHTKYKTKIPDDTKLIDIDFADLYTNRSLVELLSVRNKDEETQVKASIKIKYDYNKDKSPFKIKSKELQYKPRINPLKEVRANEETLKTVRSLVDILDIQRAEEYKMWMELGWCLFNIHNVDEFLLKIWIKFSKRVSQYKHSAEAECRKLWIKMETTTLGIGSLKQWARLDSPSKYTKVLNQSLENIIMTSVNSPKCQWDTAKVLWHMFAHEFICIPAKSPQWYQYQMDKHKWRELDCNIALRKKLSVELFNQYMLVCDQKKVQAWTAGDAAHEIVQKIISHTANLKKSAFKDNIMKEACEFFDDEHGEFIKKLDEATYLLGFNNGVYDLEADMFRDGRPEDYISISTNIDYREDFTMDSVEIKEIERFMEQVLPNDDVREYILLLMASFLNGSTKNETFHVWTGTGGNGKSLFVDIVQECLGDYACILPITLLTAKRGRSEEANPALYTTKGRRFAVLQEPDTQTRINVGALKEYTGGDKIQVRTLYKNPITFKPQFKMVLTCNDMPKLPPGDGGVWRRVRAVEFCSTFKDDPEGHWVSPDGNLLSEDEHQEHEKNDIIDKWIPKNKDYPEYPIDRDLKAKAFTYWKQPFMWYLIQKYKKYKEVGLKEPAKVIEFTEKYKKENDKILEFLEDNIVPSGDDKSCLLLKIVYEEFRFWHTENYPDERIPSKTVLKSRMDNKFGDYWDKNNSTYNKRGWRGWILKSTLELAHAQQYDDIVEDLASEL